MSSTEGVYDRRQRSEMLRIARASIAHGLNHGTPLPVRPGDFDPALRELRATFVTLNRDGRLRGCIGMLEAHRPLIQDVAENAYSAAFRDPRFPPLSTSEFDELALHVSVLSPSAAMQFDSEADLLRQIRPAIDGLILSDATHRGTFLPSVWEQLPTAELFLTHLKQKAGLAPDYWSDTLQVRRYTTESFS
ncbi:MAG: AmmeMemoRadiSam system protein A [Gammaproteobacteria bacterium]|nr:AmmeMemoRadiSam system protein A [Gammaproteobacteria bacterium]MCP5135849.1 AmmeMemoRadiSam system protein A [Gammaproteobacteria bacterium]